MTDRYDVIVVGGGPVGGVTALSFAERGARVLVLEGTPKASDRLAGEWLHPPAAEALEALGVDLTPPRPYPGGRGFVVVPEDGSDAMVLPYAAGKAGYSCEHGDLVRRIRQRLGAHPFVELSLGTRATAIEAPWSTGAGASGATVTYRRAHGVERQARAAIVVGAVGRSAAGRALFRQAAGRADPLRSGDAAGPRDGRNLASRTAGILLHGVEVPFEGYGHVYLGGLGPLLVYRIGPDKVRVTIDVPLTVTTNRDRAAVMWESYGHVLPPQLRSAFREALLERPVVWAANQIVPRVNYGAPGLPLVGDAVGHFHPLTAMGMTLGFRDALVLAELRDVDAYRRRRSRESRVPEMLALALYEVFADDADEALAIRQAIYEMWRRQPRERLRTMGFLAGEDQSLRHFARSFLSAVTIAGRHLSRDAIRTGQIARTASVLGDLMTRVRWLLRGALQVGAPTPAGTADGYGDALRANRKRAEVLAHPTRTRKAPPGVTLQTPGRALARGATHLVGLQHADGHWEGEVRWCPMLAAQYVITCHLVGEMLEPGRRSRILRQFAVTQTESGCWGLHELSEPYLFTTTLVYVAARLLGVRADDALVARAGAFIRREGVLAIPSWGKLWLAMVGLYDYRGLPPVAPELWRLPSWAPVHPSRFYCHTRLIYLAMAVIYGRRVRGAVDGSSRGRTIEELRRELYPDGYATVDFAQGRKALRERDLHARPGPILRTATAILARLETIQSPARREPLLRELESHLRHELRSTEATSISPVSGLLNIIALRAGEVVESRGGPAGAVTTGLDDVTVPMSSEVRRAISRLDGWVWEDDDDGFRIAGARSASWDTAFAVQALVRAAPHVDVAGALRGGDDFLDSQQLLAPGEDDVRYHRADRRGGYCFAHAWHGWPVSDCTAEALLARLENPRALLVQDRLELAVGFLLRSQNRDGAFGSYEARRVNVSLEWLNPAEMFGDSMTEGSYVECTASCVAALAAAAHRLAPESTLGRRVARAIDRGRVFLRSAQAPNGTWEAAWGIHYIYGTMFGVRGLLAAGVPPRDPAIRRACSWILQHQRDDGGWGEHHTSGGADGYVPGDRSLVIQSAWALTTLLEAQDPSWEAIDRGAHFLASRQLESGDWPREAPAGIFFRTAVLDYALYRRYFPVHALALHASRRAERLALTESQRRAGRVPAASA